MIKLTQLDFCYHVHIKNSDEINEQLMAFLDGWSCRIASNVNHATWMFLDYDTPANKIVIATRYIHKDDGERTYSASTEYSFFDPKLATLFKLFFG